MSFPFDRWRKRFSLEHLHLIDERCDQYEKEWKALKAPRIEEYLGDTEGLVRTTLWLELVLVDQALQSSQGKAVAIEEYQDHCPDKAILLDVSTGFLPPYVPLSSPVADESLPAAGDTGIDDSEIKHNSATPPAIQPPDPEHSDETVDLVKPIADPLMTTARFAGNPGPPNPIDLPSTIGPLEQNPEARTDPQTAPPTGEKPTLPKLPGDMGAVHACRGIVLGDYELIEMLAQGGMGIVFRAKQRKLNRIVALKTIRAGSSAEERALRLFQIEAEAVAALDHPYIVPILEIGEHQGLHYYSMKLIEGETLQDSLAYFKDHPAAIAGLMVRVADAIQHAHERGVLHRDLKPSNILIDEQGMPHVIDFGLAKPRAGERRSPRPPTSMGWARFSTPCSRADHRSWAARSLTRSGVWSRMSRIARSRSTPWSIATSRRSA
jgi:hypothetical protein